MSEDMEEAARLYDEAARELEQATRHCRTVAGHFRSHIREAEEALDEQARTHARRSVP